jgi:hypothetical protein
MRNSIRFNIYIKLLFISHFPAKNPETGHISEGVLQAYSTAESLRLGLVSVYLHNRRWRWDEVWGLLACEER